MKRPISLLALVATLSACKPAADPQAAMQMPPPTVTIANPVKQKITEWDEFTGRIEASESVRLYSQVTGYLQSTHFQDGSEVTKGQLLFQIDPRPFQATLDQASAQLEQARVRHQLAKNELDRATKLVEAKAISAEDFDTRSTALREADAGLKAAEATVAKASIDVEYCAIKAPIAGRISRRMMDVGGLVIGGPMGATELTSIVALDPIYAYIDADELSVLRYQRLNREGTGAATKEEDIIPCEMALADSTDFPFKGVIDFVDNRLDPSTGTIQVRALFDNPKPPRGQRILQPGYFARVRVPNSGEYEALLIDDKAIGSDQASKVVMVVGEGNIVAPRPVILGPVINGKRVIREGLTEQDKVIINGLSKAYPGTPVTPMTEAEASAAAAAAAPPAATAAQ
ncbi:efflux RND transporter periplasmic adaptor subunit [Phragmitibacter flavus]|uniref:Efflux RND transporter periplasmic adaptor subunit n=1 Tax=Phragmitibacter flavus TaxID=2576071 RepID=A0A5R8K8P6_9BACT|nr:efflux RND transporter periplasmic adaptor subunit [Phragmitibacter flavus]TLD68686.1 efflux RND transporter periplasmic adaptor subunit [Phragmitibacter flavus]